MGRRGIRGRRRSAEFYSFVGLQINHDHSDDPNQQTQPSVGLYWSFTSDKYNCKLLYTMYKECVQKFLEDRDADDLRCSPFRQQFEGSCGKYKSLCSSWWTENDEKKLCKKWSEFYEECKSSKGPEACKPAWLVFKNSCRGIKLD